MRRVIKKRIRREQKGLNLAADIDAVISVNKGGGSSKTVSRSHSRVVQDSRANKEKKEDG